MNEIDPIMPFGKHNNKHFSEIPRSYLQWLKDQEWIKDPIKTKLEDYLKTPLAERIKQNQNNEIQQPTTSRIFTQSKSADSELF